jgi:hypothetical protein
MENIIGLAQIGRSVNIGAATCYDTPIWQFFAWSKQTSLIPTSGTVSGMLLSASQDIQLSQYPIGTLEIDNASYTKITETDRVKALDDVRLTERTFWVDNSAGIVYFHNQSHLPAWLYYMPALERMIGFSTGKQLIEGDVIYQPGADTIPDVKDDADDLEYASMKFQSDSYTLANADGEFDDAINFIGNDFFVRHSLFPYSEIVHDIAYYIKDVKLDYDKVTFSLSDKRERLSVKVPNEYFTQTDYPYGEETSDGKPKEGGYNNGNLWGKIKPDVYGYCVHVPGICVNANDLNYDNPKKQLTNYTVAQVILGSVITLKLITKNADGTDVTGLQTFYGAMIQDGVNIWIGANKYTLTTANDDGSNSGFGTETSLDGTTKTTYMHIEGTFASDVVANAKIYLDTKVKENRTFRFARHIESIVSLQVKMTQDDTSDTETWVEQSEHIGKEITISNVTNPDTNEAIDGDLVIPIQYCMAPWTGSDVSDIYDIRATGYFHPGLLTNTGFTANTPLSIMTELLRYYGGIQYDATSYKTLSDGSFEVANELSQLNDYEIGISYSDGVDLFEAVESIQSGSVLGFQLEEDDGLITARLDDDNRTPYQYNGAQRDINAVDITNLDKVEIDMNTDNYATSIDVSYAEDYDQDDTWQHATNSKYKQQVERLFLIDKVYSVNSLLKNQEDAQKKADTLAVHFSKLRQKITNVVLYGEDWFGLRLYDVVTIDLRMLIEYNQLRDVMFRSLAKGVPEKDIISAEMKRRFVIAQRKQAQITRNFGGIIKCKVMSIDINFKAGTNTVDLLYIG